MSIVDVRETTAAISSSVRNACIDASTMTPSAWTDRGVLDPRRAEFFAKLGLRTISPTQTAISTLVSAVRACEVPDPTAAAEVEVKA